MYVNTSLNTRDPKPSGASRLGGEKDAQAEGFTKTQQWSHGGGRDEEGARPAQDGGVDTCWRYGVIERVRGHVNKGALWKKAPVDVPFCSWTCLRKPP